MLKMTDGLSYLKQAVWPVLKQLKQIYNNYFNKLIANNYELAI